MRRDYDWPLIISLLVVALAFACLLASIVLVDQADVQRWADDEYAVMCWQSADGLACLPESEVLPR